MASKVTAIKMTSSSNNVKNNNNKNFGDQFARDFILDFQSIDFKRDSHIANDVLASYASRAGFSDKNRGDGKARPLFSLSEPTQAAGWSFSKLMLSAEFVNKLYELNSYEIDSTSPFSKVNGKHYRGDFLTTKIVSWIVKKLRDNGCQANVKIGEEMADFSYRGGGVWTGAGPGI